MSRCIFGEMDHHEAAAADIAGAGIGDGQCETDGDCGIDRIAAAVEDLDADTRGALLLRHHHAVVRKDRRGRRAARRLGRARRFAQREQRGETAG